MENANLTEELIVSRYTEMASDDSLGCARLDPWMEISQGDHVLDLGCGSGGQAIALSEKVGPSGSVTGVDITQAMVDKANAK